MNKTLPKSTEEFYKEHGVLHKYITAEDYIPEIKPDTVAWLPLANYPVVKNKYEARQAFGVFKENLNKEIARRFTEGHVLIRIKLIPLLKSAYQLSIIRQSRSDQYYIYRVMLKKPAPLAAEEFKEILEVSWRDTRLPDRTRCCDTPSFFDAPGQPPLLSPPFK